MAEDIDDLLDEVESKFVKDKAKERKITSTIPKRRKPEDEDLNQLIDDICGDSEPLEKCNIAPRQVPSQTSQKIRPPSSKCFTLYIGGTAVTTGFGNSFNKRCCDTIRCTACDFRVASFDNFDWDLSTDYLFLRNNAPDFDRLKSKLNSRKGYRAYCCQCSHTAVNTLTDIKDLPMKWVCGKH